VVLTLIAEVLAGETRITPGGAVDTETACCLEAFTWDGWLEQLRSTDDPLPYAELTATPVATEAPVAR
jgi:hypothetical protein